MNTEYELYDQIGAVDVYFESKQQSKIEYRLSKYYKQFEKDIEILNKYINHNVRLFIDLKQTEEYGGYAKLIKPKIFSRDEPTYDVSITTETMDCIIHEFGHVIDRVSSKEQYSKQKDFKPMLDTHKTAIKEKIKSIKESDMPAETKRKHIAYWNSPYRNGNAPSEIFARYCEYYLKERESLTFTMRKYTTFDRFCHRQYQQNKQQIDEYFDKLFEDILTTEIDTNIDEDIDEEEFRYSIETIDSEYKQINNECLIC